MRTLFFCARNITDYFIIDNKREILANAAKITVREVLENADAQKFLYAQMNLYADREKSCNSPVYGETGIDGLRIDFNFGLRLEIPVGNFHVTISDADSGIIFLDEDLSDVRLISVEKYFIRWQVEISLNGEKIFLHTLDLEGQPVLIASRLTGLGDIISLLPYVKAFKDFYRCDVKIFIESYLREFATYLYPELIQVDSVTFDNYATYYPAMCVGDYPVKPLDVRNEPMERSHRKILGLNILPNKPTFKPTEPRQIAEPYVCIGVQASYAKKCWHWQGGWDIVVDYLKSLGYRVLCIDKNAQEIDDGFTICKPKNAEDFTGNFSIMQRANMLYYAEFFIGLGSGLSWLANAVNCPVVMICGFSQDWFEFYTPYRVANRLVCNGCFNDVRVDFIKNRCPYHQGTERELECQKKISPQQVINAIECLRQGD